MKDVLEAAGKSLWKEVRDLAVKKGTETFVSEGIKSILEVVKRRRIRRDEYDFAEWKKARKEEEDKAKRAARGDDVEKKDAAAEEQPEDAKPAQEDEAADDAASPDAPDTETPDTDE